MKLADALDCCVNAFTAARQVGEHTMMTKTISDIRGVLKQVDVAKGAVGNAATDGKYTADIDRGNLWKSQFVWGFHGLALAAQHAGLFGEATEAFRTCVE